MLFFDFFVFWGLEVLFFWVGFRDDLRSNTLSVSKDDDLTVESFRGLRGTGGEAGLGGVTTRFSPGNFWDVRGPNPIPGLAETTE